MYSGLQINIAFQKATETSSNRSIFPNKSPGTRWEMFCKRVSKELIRVYLFSSYILQVGKKMSLIIFWSAILRNTIQLVATSET